MQILPSLPTDNIYKLKAIAGLWMLAGFVVLGFWSVYWQYQLEVQTRHTMSYYSSVNTERDVLARMKSMREGKFNENILKWVPPNLTISEEQNLLKIALENHRGTIALYKKEAEEERGHRGHHQRGHQQADVAARRRAAEDGLRLEPGLRLETGVDGEEAVVDGLSLRVEDHLVQRRGAAHAGCCCDCRQPRPAPDARPDPWRAGHHAQ